MVQELITLLSFAKLGELIINAQKIIIYSAASIHDEIAIYLCEAKKNDIKINVIIDANEDNIRNGFGEIKAVDNLQKNGVEVKQIDGNLISFIIIDEIGYFFFDQSKIFIDEAKGPNAVLMDSITMAKLVAFYYQPLNEDDGFVKDYSDDINRSYDSNKELESLDYLSYSSSYLIKDIDDNNIKEIKKNLKLNPPIKPDIKRKINTYSAKVQFAELNFVGSNLSSLKVKIPKDALPFKDHSLKKSLETKLKLFENIETNNEFNKLKKMKDQVESLRIKKYSTEEEIKSGFLISVSCRNKSVIKIESKQKFISEVKEIQQEIDKYKANLLKELRMEVLERKKAIRTELLEFLKKNPPEEFSNENDSLYLFANIDDLSQKIVNKIEFPDISKYMTEMKLNYHFYDLTFEDFTDDKLIEEFRVKNILNSTELDEIVSMKDAFEAIEE
jgi:hypothetical protein